MLNFLLFALYAALFAVALGIVWLIVGGWGAVAILAGAITWKLRH